MAQLQNKVVLITGAIGGLGTAFSRAVVAQGASVVLDDIDTA